MSEYPVEPINHDRQYQLSGNLAYAEVKGVMLELWQYKVTGAARVWYCPNAETRTVWMVKATPRHPKETERRR
jgi:hypothetical protein